MNIHVWALFARCLELIKSSTMQIISAPFSIVISTRQVISSAIEEINSTFLLFLSFYLTYVVWRIYSCLKNLFTPHLTRSIKMESNFTRVVPTSPAFFWGGREKRFHLPQWVDYYHFHYTTILPHNYLITKL